MTKATAFLVALLPLAVTGTLVAVEQAVHGYMDAQLEDAMDHVGQVAVQLPEERRVESTERLVAAALADAGIPGGAEVQVDERLAFEGPALAIDVRVAWDGVLELVPHPDLLQHQIVVSLP